MEGVKGSRGWFLRRGWRRRWKVLRRVRVRADWKVRVAREVKI